MKWTLCVSLLLGSCIWADESADRAGVAATMARLSASDPQPLLFTADFADAAEYGRAATVGSVVISKEPWGEATIVLPGATMPRFVVRSVRFVTGDVALVDALDRKNDNGTVLLVMRKEGVDWRVAAFRRIEDARKAAP